MNRSCNMCWELSHIFLKSPLQVPLLSQWLLVAVLLYPGKIFVCNRPFTHNVKIEGRGRQFLCTLFILLAEHIVFWTVDSLFWSGTCVPGAKHVICSLKLFFFSFTCWREWLVHVDTNQYVVASKQSLSIFLKGHVPRHLYLMCCFSGIQQFFCKMEWVGQIFLC